MFDSIDLQNELVYTSLVVAAILLGTFVLSRITSRIAKNFVSEPARLYNINRLIRRIFGILALTLIIGFFSPRIGDIMTILTVVGAGIAIALREALLSLAGWFYISLMKLYAPGDRIEVNGITGDVLDIRLFKTTLLEIRNWVDADQNTGRLVHFPNGWLFLHAVQNFSHGFNFIWNELPVTLTFRSDWNRARDIMAEFANETARMVEHQASQELRQLSREYLIHYSILTPFVYVRIVDNGVRLTLRYLCDVRKRRGTEHALTISILEAFSNETNIEFAYPMIGVAQIEGPQFGNIPSPPPPTNPA